MSITHPTIATGGDSPGVIGQTAWNESHTVNVTGILMGSGGDVVAAVPGVDYIATPDIGLDIAMSCRLALL